MLRRLASEPLVHFVVLGLLIFAFFGRSTPARDDRRITLTAEGIAALRDEHRERTGNFPTAEEEQALIDEFIEAELLYREGLRLGLDRNDPVVRERMREKMKFVLESDVPSEPSDEELARYLDANVERYRVPGRVSIRHVFASRERHGDDVLAVARGLRARLLAGVPPRELGDPFLGGHELRLRTQAELERIFGRKFAAAVAALAVDEWSEPIESDYGRHVVRVEQRLASATPRVADVRRRLVRDWLAEARADARRAGLAELRARYDVRVARGPVRREPPVRDAVGP